MTAVQLATNPLLAANLNFPAGHARQVLLSADVWRCHPEGQTPLPVLGPQESDLVPAPQARTAVAAVATSRAWTTPKYPGSTSSHSVFLSTSEANFPSGQSVQTAVSALEAYLPGLHAAHPASFAEVTKPSKPTAQTLHLLAAFEPVPGVA
jgi:hypothetical protein